MNNEITQIEVGILKAENIRFRLNGKFNFLSGENGNPIFIVPENYEEASFDLFDVTIGVEFHWERKEIQRFKGTLKLLSEKNEVTAINILPIEDYLTSVISSEMSARSSLELLKAHAVISRSWLLAQRYKKEEISQKTYQSEYKTADEYIKWYDREDHTDFDVCADDHCQRYQGVTKVTTEVVEQAVRSTEGKVLMYEGKICDTRFSKCCGGASEAFEYVWEPVKHPYLTKVMDNPHPLIGFKSDLRKEDNAERWILGHPEAFCNTKDEAVLSQVLNDYDRETQQFFRWKEEITQEKIQKLLLLNTGYDFGDIIDLIPQERGLSGRLIKLKILGTKKTLVIGKELFIRKTLSDSHLYSAAFVVEKEYNQSSSSIPERFILMGAGWGHGVGLCQIGAAVMAAKGHSYEEILKHYFPGSELEKIF